MRKPERSPQQTFSRSEAAPLLAARFARIPGMIYSEYNQNELQIVWRKQLEVGLNTALSKGWVCVDGISFTFLGDFPSKPFMFSYAQAVIRAPESSVD
jgi:hypothetical protein